MTSKQLAFKSMADHLVAFAEEFDKTFPDAASALADQAVYNRLTEIRGELIKWTFDLEYLRRDGDLKEPYPPRVR
jgi:hypothetical protein